MSKPTRTAPGATNAEPLPTQLRHVVTGTASKALVPHRGKTSAAPKPRSSRRYLWAGLAAAAGLGGWLSVAQPWSTRVAIVPVEVVTPGPVTRVLAINGRIAARSSVAVRSTVAGTLVPPLAEEGDVVAQGDVLARLDDTSQQAAVRQAVAAYDQGLVAQAQAREALTRSEALRASIPRVALDDARRAVERAEQEVGRLSALVEQAQFQLAKFAIAAPITGTILTRSVDPGQVVDLTTPLFTLADLGELVVETNVDESYGTQVKTGMPALLQLTGDPRTLDGRVSFVAPLVDANTGGLAVKIAFSQPQSAPVGLTVTTNIIIDRQDAAISVPRSAIVTSDAAQSVFVLQGEQARHVPVTVIDWPADRLIVTKGLAPGDTLIVDADNLGDGQRVAAKEQ